MCGYLRILFSRFILCTQINDDVCLYGKTSPVNLVLCSVFNSWNLCDRLVTIDFWCYTYLCERFIRESCTYVRWYCNIISEADALQSVGFFFIPLSFQIRTFVLSTVLSNTCSFSCRLTRLSCLWWMLFHCILSSLFCCCRYIIALLLSAVNSFIHFHLLFLYFYINIVLYKLYKNPKYGFF